MKQLQVCQPSVSHRDMINGLIVYACNRSDHPVLLLVFELLQNEELIRSCILLHKWNWRNGPLDRYAKLWVVHALRMPGTFSPPPRDSDPNMHHGTCVTHVPWCMPGSLTNISFEVGGGENVPGIPGACAIRNFNVSGKRPMFLTSNQGPFLLRCIN